MTIISRDRVLHMIMTSYHVTLSTSADLLRHLHDTHGEPRKQYCEKCDKYFGNRKSLWRHNRATHLTDEEKSNGAPEPAFEEGEEDEDELIYRSETRCKVCYDWLALPSLSIQGKEARGGTILCNN